MLAFVLFLSLFERKEHAFLHLFTGSNSFCAADNAGCKICQSYNGNGLPACMQKWLRSGREIGVLFGVALSHT